jgi:hypothetical protein
MKNYLLLLITIFISLSLIHADSAEDVHWYPRVRFPEKLYNQKEPKPFDLFVAQLYEKNLTVQDDIKKRLQEQREIAKRRTPLNEISKENLAKVAYVKKCFQQEEERENKPLDIIWEKKNITPQDKELIEKTIKEHSLKGTIYIEDIPHQSKNGGTLALSKKEFSIMVYRRHQRLLFGDGAFSHFGTIDKKKTIIGISDELLQKSKESKKAIIAHEVAHLQLNHSLEGGLLRGARNSSDLSGIENCFKGEYVAFRNIIRQQELEADILATIASIENARCMCSLYDTAKEITPQMANRFQIDIFKFKSLVHQLPQDSYHNARIIYQLLLAQQRWFDGQLGYEKYSEPAYEYALYNAYEKEHYEKYGDPTYEKAFYDAWEQNVAFKKLVLQSAAITGIILGFSALTTSIAYKLGLIFKGGK